MTESTVTPKPLDSLAVATIIHDVTYLMNASEVGAPVVHDDGSIMKEGKGRILHFLVDLTQYLDAYGLCTNETPHLHHLVTAFESKYSKGYYRNLDQHDYEELSNAIDRIEALIQEVIKERNFAETTPTTGLLNYRKLLAQGIEGLFRGDEAVEALPEIVAEDINDAIRCLAFDIPTPSVMISLRATEGMLRETYELFFKKTAGPWSETSTELFSKLKEMQIDTAGIEGYLSHIRTIRNSAEHPEKRFSLKEAEDLLMNAQYAIVELLKLRQFAPRPPA